MTARLGRLFLCVLALALGLVVPATPANAASAYVGSASLSSGDGYWLVSARGAVRAQGNALHLGDAAASALNQPIVGMASTPSGHGYWLVAGDGGIFAYGDAAFYGSTGNIRLNKPIVGMASTPSGHGYWMVATDGGIFAYGDAAFYGSTGDIVLNKPVVGMSAQADGRGYWMVATDGGIFAFGSSRFFGSTGAIKLNQPVVAMSTSGTGNGYWLAASDGGIFAFGDAVFHGAGVRGSSAPAISLVRDTQGGYTIVTAAGEAERKAPGEVVNSGPISQTGPWQLSFEDDFDTNVGEGSFLNSYGSKWSAYPTSYQDTARIGRYNPDLLSVNNGVMNMRLHTANGVPQCSAPMPKVNGANGSLNQLYGRYEVRFRADPTPGWAAAWLLWPETEVWPRDGEIDFPEGRLDGRIGAFMHHQGGLSGGDQDAFDTQARFADWHTAVIEWQPDRVTFILDNAVIGTSTSRIPNTPMRWTLQTETAYGSVPAANAEANVQIDYVKVWKYVP